MIEDLLRDYIPSTDTAEIVRTTNLALLVGITGAGKDTIKKVLLKTGIFHESISYTTRLPRLNHGVIERDGVDYHFVTEHVMEKLLKQGEMIEINRYSSNLYGSGVQDLLLARQKGKVAINDIEVQGVRGYKEIAPNAHAFFILPPSYKEWKRRISDRYGDTDAAHDNIDLRIETAHSELKESLAMGYFEFVVNDSIENAVHQVEQYLSGDSIESLMRSGRAVARNLCEDFGTHLARVPR